MCGIICLELGDGLAPFRFETPPPSYSIKAREYPLLSISRRLRNSHVNSMPNSISPQQGYTIPSIFPVLRHARCPVSPDSLKDHPPKAKSSMVAATIPNLYYPHKMEENRFKYLDYSRTGIVGNVGCSQ